MTIGRAIAPGRGQSELDPAASAAGSAALSPSPFSTAPAPAGSPSRGASSCARRPRKPRTRWGATCRRLLQACARAAEAPCRRRSRNPAARPAAIPDGELWRQLSGRKLRFRRAIVRRRGDGWTESPLRGRGIPGLDVCKEALAVSADIRAKSETPISDRRLEEVRRLFERYRRTARERYAVSSDRQIHPSGSLARQAATPRVREQ
jgi:hypothetical protein